ncbi:MAG TPA: hypothetical protein VJU58_10085 [Microbacterium sp.]|nr:hypothetical protein [Microbacterium sp.]
MKYALPGSGDLNAIKADGTIAANDTANGCTLTSGTWYFAFGGSDAPLPGETALVTVQLQWAAAVAGAITVEVTNYPEFRDGRREQGPTDVGDNDGNATRTNWVQINPSTGYVPPPTGAGNSVSGLTLTAGGTNAGGTIIDLGNLGARRCRLKLVLTVGGLVRVNVNAKVGA